MTSISNVVIDTPSFKPLLKTILTAKVAPEQQVWPGSLTHSSELSWWVEIKTSVPLCTYYFGPFESQKEARNSRKGYVDDLEHEDARDIIALVKQCQPNKLTIDGNNGARLNHPLKN